MVWTISWWTRKHWRRPQERPAYRVSQWQQCREDFSIVASKPPPFAKNASRWGEHWQRHSEKDCSWRIAKTEDLFVLCSTLTPEQKNRRIAGCRDLIATADSDPDFFKKTVTGDETWCFAYDATTKRQSAAWVGETSPRPKKIAISEVSCEDNFRLAKRNPQRICSGGWKYQCSVLQSCNGKAPEQNSTC